METDGFARAVAAHTAKQTAYHALGAIERSRLFGSGAALLLAGFIGLWNMLVFKLVDAVTSAYVMLFGAMLVAFSSNIGQASLKRYFGFLYSEHGQVVFLVVAGNLAWSIGWVGVLAAALCNFTAIVALREGRHEPPGLAAAAPASAQRQPEEL